MQIHRYCFVVVFEESCIRSRALVVLGFLLSSLTKSMCIASAIGKRYTRLSFPPTVEEEKGPTYSQGGP